MSRHLVLGATGQVGASLADALEAAGEAVVRTGYRRAADLTVDLGDPDAVTAALEAINPEVVWLVGAYTHVDGCEADPDRSRRINRDGPARAAAWAGASGARVVLFSTDYVFDGTAGPYREEDPPHPLSVYGRDKLAAEQAVRAVPGGLVLRTAWVYSWEREPKNFCQRLAVNLAAGHAATIPDDQWGNPTYAPDLARAAVALAARGVTGIVHVAGPRIVTRYAFALLIADAFGLNRELIHPASTASLGQVAPRPLRAGLHLQRLWTLLGDDAAHLAPRPPEVVLPELAAAHGASLGTSPASPDGSGR